MRNIRNLGDRIDERNAKDTMIEAAKRMMQDSENVFGRGSTKEGGAYVQVTLTLQISGLSIPWEVAK